MGSILAAVLFFLPSSSSSSSALRDSALGYARLWHLRSLSMSIFLSLSLPHSLALRRFHIAVTEAAGLDPGAGEPAARPRRADDTGMPNRRGVSTVLGGKGESCCVRRSGCNRKQRLDVNGMVNFSCRGKRGMVESFARVENQRIFSRLRVEGHW